MDPEPSVDEIEGIIARTEGIRDKWRGNPGYARALDIELQALQLLREHQMVKHAAHHAPNH